MQKKLDSTCLNIAMKKLNATSKAATAKASFEKTITAVQSIAKVWTALGIDITMIQLQAILLPQKQVLKRQKPLL